MTLERVAELVWLMMPAYCANMAPPFVKHWHGWNRPINRELLGDHKTVVGFAAGVLAGVITALVQSRLPVALSWPNAEWLVVGLAQGGGAMLGDATKSYFKRRAGIRPGGVWIPADQLDFVIGALILLSFMVPLGWAEVAVILIFTFVADIVVNHISFYFGIRGTKW